MCLVMESLSNQLLEVGGPSVPAEFGLSFQFASMGMDSLKRVSVHRGTPGESKSTQCPKSVGVYPCI